MLDLLENDEFYAVLRSRMISKTDRAYIEEFASKTLTAEEWDDFSTHCIQNQIDPYKEMREIIYATYAKILKKQQQ
jgi:hypothetical protein